MTGALPARHRGVGIAGTTIAHATLIVLAIVAARRAIPRGPQVYEVNLVAAPLPSAGSRTADATKTPAPKAVAPVKSKPVPPTVKPTSKPTPAPTAKAPAPANGSAPAALIKTPVVPAPGEKPSTGSDVATVHQDGLVFPYPEYLKKIENAIYNNWNHQSFRPGLEARIAFVITKSGIVPDSSYNVMKASSNSSFDNASRGAIEAASNKHEFGPLPDGFNGASLPILFVFKQVPPEFPMKMLRALATTTLLLLAQRASAQDSRITLGVSGSSAAQPGLAVLAGPGLDSVRAIVQRDLGNSDRFTIAPLSADVATLRGPLDPVAIKNIPGLNWAVELQPAAGGVNVKLYDAATGTVRHEETRPAELLGVGDGRVTIHRLSDLIVSWTGGIGIAATRIAFKGKNGNDDAIWRVDSDGANLVRITKPGEGIMLSPSWSPDGSMVAYSVNRDYRWTIRLLKLATGTPTFVTSSTPGDSYGANFSPDGKSMVYSHALAGGGTSIESVDIKQNCCAHRLTDDRRNADNVSPSYSHDGRHIAYISNRTGSTQIWVMDEDGSSGEPLVAAKYSEAGRPLDTNSPVWSPDGTRIAFSRDVEHGFRQVFTASVTGGQVVQHTNISQNEDASWAPDSRHLVFKSRRSGREQLWILDIESANSRQLTNVAGEARFPAWSRILGTTP